MVAVEVVAPKASIPAPSPPQLFMGRLDRILGELERLVAHLAELATRGNPHPLMLGMTARAAVRAHDLAGVREARLEETIDWVAVVGPLVAALTVPVVHAAKAEVRGAGAATEQILEVRLYLLPGGPRGSLVALVAGEVLMPAVHGPLRVRALQLRQ